MTVTPTATIADELTNFESGSRVSIPAGSPIRSTT